MNIRMERTCNTHGRGEIHQAMLWLKNPMERGHLEDQRVYGRIIVKRMQGNCAEVVQDSVKQLAGCRDGVESSSC
jgi:predicted nucleotidyltransferase